MKRYFDRSGCDDDWNFTKQTSSEVSFESRLSAARSAGAWLFDPNRIQAMHRVAPSLVYDEVVSLAPRPAEIDGIVAEARREVVAMQDAATAMIQAAQQQCAADQGAFIARMEAAKAQAELHMTAVIDQAYAQLMATGQQYPDAQPLLVQAVGELAALVADGSEQIGATFDTAAAAAQSAIDAVAEAAEKAAKGIVSIATSVGEGIAGIFSDW